MGPLACLSGSTDPSVSWEFHEGPLPAFPASPRAVFHSLPRSVIGQIVCRFAFHESEPTARRGRSLAETAGSANLKRFAGLENERLMGEEAEEILLLWVENNPEIDDPSMRHDFVKARKEIE
jgi:hypothetical protein